MQAIINGEMYEVEPAVKVIIDKLMIENADLKKENARLEEGYQKSLGVIAADALPTFAEMRKVSEMCKKTKCTKCIYFDKKEHHCRFDDGAGRWNFGGADEPNNNNSKEKDGSIPEWASGLYDKFIKDGESE